MPHLPSVPSSIPTLLHSELLLLDSLRHKNAAQHRSGLFFRRVEEIAKLGGKVYECLTGYNEERQKVNAAKTSGFNEVASERLGRKASKELKRLQLLVQKLLPALTKATHSINQMIHHLHFLPLSALLLAIYSRLFHLALLLNSSLLRASSDPTAPASGEGKSEISLEQVVESATANREELRLLRASWAASGGKEKRGSKGKAKQWDERGMEGVDVGTLIARASPSLAVPARISTPQSNIVRMLSPTLKLPSAPSLASSVILSPAHHSPSASALPSHVDWSDGERRKQKKKRKLPRNDSVDTSFSPSPAAASPSTSVEDPHVPLSALSGFRPADAVAGLSFSAGIAVSPLQGAGDTTDVRVVQAEVRSDKAEVNSAKVEKRKEKQKKRRKDDMDDIFG